MYAVIFGNNLSNEGFIVGDEVDVVCSIDINEFRGNKNVQLIVRDIDRSEKDKARIAEECDTVRSSLADTSKIDRRDVPERDDFVKVYTEIKKAESEKIDMRVFVQLFPDYSYVKLAVILKAFSEAGLITVENDGTRPFLLKIIFNKVDGKTDLFQTPIMREINEK